MTLTLTRLHTRTELVDDFMTLRRFMALWPYGSVVLWLHGLAWPRSSLTLVPGPRPAPVLDNAHPGASLGHDFMTLRAFPGLHNPMALWFSGSMVPRPRSAPVLASARPRASLEQDFMTFWGV